MDTRLYPCVVENLNQPNFALCACYELDEATGNREGEIFTFEIKSNLDISIIDTIRLDAGVLDCKIFNSTLYAALSTEQLKTYRIEDNHLHEFYSVSKDGEGLFLSVSVVQDKFAVSTQQGSLLIYQAGEASADEICFASQAHKLSNEPVPAWITAINPHNTNIVVSGGDDCKFRLWDIRLAGEEIFPTSTKAFHDAGVTSAQWHPTRENFLALGSYDEHITIWDVRNLKKPVLHHHTGGGVWRCKWIDIRPNRGNYDFILTANMQGGCNVYNLRWESDNTEVLVDSTKHFSDESPKHLSYGIDTISSNNFEDEENICHKFSISSCSFYDRKLSFWDAEFITPVGKE